MRFKSRYRAVYKILFNDPMCYKYPRNPTTFNYINKQSLKFSESLHHSNSI